MCWKYLYPSINPTRWQKNRRSVSLHSAMFQEEFCCLLVRKFWVSERQHMEPSRFVRWGHPVTVGAVQCDRCYCRPARQGNKPIPLICHLIPLSTGLPSESTHNMLRMHRHLHKKNTADKTKYHWHLVIFKVDILVFCFNVHTQPIVSKFISCFELHFIVFTVGIQCCITFCPDTFLSIFRGTANTYSEIKRPEPPHV